MAGLRGTGVWEEVCKKSLHFSWIPISQWNYRYQYLMLAFVIMHLPHRAIGTNEVWPVKHFITTYNPDFLYSGEHLQSSF